MGRPAEVFVRPVTVAEGRRLQRIGRTAKDPVKLRWAIVVLMSAQGQAVPGIAQLLDCSPEYVRAVIHAFNESGFAALEPKWSGGRPKTISEHARRQVCLIARCCPGDLGLAFGTWSLASIHRWISLIASASGLEKLILGLAVGVVSCRSHFLRLVHRFLPGMLAGGLGGRWDAVTGSGLVRPPGRVGRRRLRTGSSIRSRGAILWAGAR
jgi:transposase